MPAPTLITDLSTTAASNSPAGSETPSVLDDVQRAHAAFIAQLRDNKVSWGGTAGGTANAFTLTPSPASTSYVTGQAYQFIAVGTNTGAATVNISALGAKAVQYEGAALTGNEILSGKMYSIRYDGTQFQLDRSSKGQTLSATSRILGRKSAGAGVVEECTLSEILDFISSAAQGDILYRDSSAWARLGAGTSGQFLKTQGAAANPVWANGSGATIGTVVDTSTGATSYTVTGLPSGVKKIAFAYGGISTNGTASLMIRVGPSGGVVTSGYAGAVHDGTNSVIKTDGFYIDDFGAAAAVRHGRGDLQLVDASTNTWSWESQTLSSDSNRAMRSGAGTISLAGALERFQIIANGTDTFDAGKLNILYWT